MIVDELKRFWGIPLDLHAAPIDKAWKGSAAHMKSPKATATLLSGLNGSAGWLLHAGCLVWAHERLRGDGAEEVATLGHLAEALLCFQADPRYVRPVDEHQYFPLTNDDGVAVGASKVLTHLFFKSYCSWPHKRPIRGHGPSLNMTVYIVKDLMPKGSQHFGRWFKASVRRLTEVSALPGPVAYPAKAVSRHLVEQTRTAAKADPTGPVALQARVVQGISQSGVAAGTPDELAQGERAFGPPLDPWTIPDGAPPDGNGLDRFLRSIDHAANPLLHTPAELVELGLPTPYRYPSSGG
jgi:hypothetical protein